MTGKELIIYIFRRPCVYRDVDKIKENNDEQQNN